MVLTGLITIVTAILHWYLFQDFPTNSQLLTSVECVAVTPLVKENQTSVKVFGRG